MIAVSVRNVNEALPEACHQILQYGERGDSRNGQVLSCRGVFLTEYHAPTERVLFEPLRDCNPFFHLFEAIWMLAGRNDVAWLSQFNGNIADYSDNGIHFHGTYGFRWRQWYGHDQLSWIAGRLRRDPDDRRCVLAMWDGRIDPSVADRDGKDVPCNLSVSFHRRNGELDMHVFNRSNDLVWGAYGANVVHFSLMQEYLAALIGCGVGRYSQVSSNTHVYEKHWPMVEQLAAKVRGSREDTVLDPYGSTDVVRSPLVVPGEDPATFDMDVQTFLSEAWRAAHYFTEFFRMVVLPMRCAYEEFADKDNPNRVAHALEELEPMPGDADWTLACQQWLQRRQK